MGSATKDKDETKVDEAKAKADADRKAKAEKAKVEKAAKAEEAKAAKEAEAKIKAEAKAKQLQERLQKIADEGGVKLEDVKGTGKDGALTVGDVRKAVSAAKAEARKNAPKKASLTLSQRRAMLKLGEGDQVPKSGFNALPYEHLVGVGLASKEEVLVDGPKVKVTEGEGDDKKTVEKDGPQVKKDKYTLTDLGKERVSEINPKWRDWKPAQDAAAS